MSCDSDPAGAGVAFGLGDEVFVDRHSQLRLHDRLRVLISTISTRIRGRSAPRMITGVTYTHEWTYVGGVVRDDETPF